MYRRLIAAFLVFILFCTASCGTAPSPTTADVDETPLLIGTWETDLDVISAIRDQLAARSEGFDVDTQFTLKSFSFHLTLSFDEDGTYRLSLDRERLQNDLNELADSDELLETLTAYLRYYFKLPEEITLDGALSFIGMSFDALKERVLAEIFSDQWLDRWEQEGRFEARGGKLYRSDSPGAVPALADPVEYSVDGDELILRASSETETSALFPIVFRRAA